jgi:mannosyltransferase
MATRTQTGAAPARPAAAAALMRADPATAAVAALTLVALLLRLPLVRDSLLGDELIMYGIVHGHGLGDVLSIVRDTEKTPPLHFVLARASVQLGDATVTIRLPSLLAGAALVPATYALGLRTVGRTAALAAAAILALAPYQLFYSTEARAYALVAFFAVISTLCLLRALESRRPAWWAAYVLAVLAVGYTHYVGVFVLVAQAAWAAWTHRDRLRELAVVHGLIVLGYAPWLPSYVVQEGHSGDEARRIALLAPPSPAYFAKVIGQISVGEPFVSLRDVPGAWAVALAGVAVAAGALAAVVRAARGARPERRVVLVGLLALATPLGIVLLTLRPGQSFLLPRNLIASTPAIALLAAYWMVRLPRRAAAAAVAATLLVLVVGAAGALEHAHRRSGYHDAAAFIDARARPGDPVIQHFILPVKGSLADGLAIYLDRPLTLFRVANGSAGAAWARGRRTGRVFVVVPLPGYFKAVRHLPVRDGPGRAFVRVAERRWSGIEDLLVGEYVPRGS